MIKLSDVTYARDTLREAIYKKLDRKIKRADKAKKMSVRIKFSYRIPSILINEILEEYKKEGFDVTTWYDGNFFHNGLNMWVLVDWR